MREGVEREKARARELWRTSCEQLSEYDSIISEKDAELERLRGKIREMEAHEPDTRPGRVGFIDEYPTPLGAESCTVVPGPTTYLFVGVKLPQLIPLVVIIPTFVLMTGFPPFREQPHGIGGLKKSC